MIDLPIFFFGLRGIVAMSDTCQRDFPVQQLGTYSKQQHRRDIPKYVGVILGKVLLEAVGNL